MIRSMILGLDGAVPYTMFDGARAGRLPNLARLMARGAHGLALPFPAAVTPGNWASIATGARPITHGISDFSLHIPGQPFTDHVNAFDPAVCEAEFIWDALSRQGLRCATISYPGALPRRSPGHIAIGNRGQPGENCDCWTAARAGAYACGVSLEGPYGWREQTDLQITAPGAWAGLPAGHQPRAQAALRFAAAGSGWSGALDALALLVSAPDGDRLVIAPRADYAARLADLHAGEWSGIITATFSREGRPVEVQFRLRPRLLDAANGRFALYASAIYPAGEFSDPPEVGASLTRKLGPYRDTLDISRLLTGWLDADGLLDSFREQGVWQARAALELAGDGVAAVFAKWHAFDKFYHFFFHAIDPISPLHDPARFDEFERIHLGIQAIADEMIGIALDGMDDETLLVVVSDHGLTPSVRQASVNNFLRRQGYLAADFEDGKAIIDWSRTRAVMHPFTQVWVNLKGRDPQGIVEPRDYDALRDEIVEALRSWRDEDGRHVMAEVFKIEEGGFYGLGHPRDGDIRYFTAPGISVYRNVAITPDGALLQTTRGPYTGDHGSSRPSTRFGRGSETAMFAIAGPGITQGIARRAPVLLCDIAPTLAHLMRVEPPAHCEGAVLRDLLARKT